MAGQVTRATVADFRAEFPEFSEIGIDQVETLLRRASRFHTATKAGTLYAAAHLYAIGQASKNIVKDNNNNDTQIPSSADGGMGVITKETIGPKTVEYMTTAGEEPRKVFWATTPYGREFMVIEQRNVRQGFGILVG